MAGATEQTPKRAREDVPEGLGGNAGVNFGVIAPGMDRMPGWARAYVRWTDGAAEVTGWIAASLIFVMVAVLLLDAVTRNVVQIPLSWCVEFAQFTLAAYFFLGGAMTLRDDDHVRMDLVYARLSPRGRSRMDLVTVLCLGFYLVVMIRGSWSSLGYAIATDERRFSMWNPSMIPIKGLMLFCLALMLLQALSLALKHWAALRVPPDPDGPGAEAHR